MHPQRFLNVLDMDMLAVKYDVGVAMLFEGDAGHQGLELEPTDLLALLLEGAEGSNGTHRPAEDALLHLTGEQGEVTRFKSFGGFDLRPLSQVPTPRSLY